MCIVITKILQETVYFHDVIIVQTPTLFNIVSDEKSSFENEMDFGPQLKVIHI